jgi:hypothetical protein
MNYFGFENCQFIDHPHVKKELLFSINILAWRVIGNALDVEVMKMVPECRNFDNPFLALQNEFDILNAQYKDNPDFISRQQMRFINKPKSTWINVRVCEYSFQKILRSTESPVRPIRHYLRSGSSCKECRILSNYS